MQTYVVKKGDDLWTIAVKIFKIKPEDLYRANPQIKNRNLIYAGQKINVPVPPAKKPASKPATKPPAKPATPPKTSTPPKLPSVALLDKPLVASMGKSMAGTAKIKGMFDDVSFSFNPEEIMDDKGNEFTFTDTSNNYYPILHYKGGKTPTIQFELYANDREDPNAVDRLINKLDKHIPSEFANKHNGMPVKPMIFSFGKHLVKRVWLEDYKLVRKSFNQQLKTTEVTISVSLIVHTG